MLEEWQIAGYEVWKDIKEFDGKYQISTWGNLRSIKKDRIKILPGRLSNSGFLIAQMSKNGKSVSKNIHILVAETFIPNPHDLREIRHVDGSKMNNYVDNLMWQSTSNRVAWKECNKNGLIKYNLEGKKIKIYEYGINQALHDMKIPESKKVSVSQSIRGCCTGKANTAYGYKWKYIERSNKRMYDCL